MTQHIPQTPETRKPLLTYGEEFALKALRSQGPMTAKQIGRCWTTESDDRWASPMLRILRGLGLVSVDRQQRPWTYSITEAGIAEAERRTIR